MDSNPRENTSSVSTHTSWKWARIRSAPQAIPSSGPKGPHTSQLARREARKPLTVTVVWRGGPECWWELRSRGAVVRVPGHVSVHDALNRFYGGAL